MKFHGGRQLFLAAAVLGGLAVLATGLLVAVGVRSVVAGPGAGPTGPVMADEPVGPHADVDESHGHSTDTQADSELTYIELERVAVVDLASLPPASAAELAEVVEIPPPREATPTGHEPEAPEAAEIQVPIVVDQAAASPQPLAPAPAPPKLRDWIGLGSTDNPGGLVPPDPQVAVGPNHVVEDINVTRRIWDKDGNVLHTVLLRNFYGKPAGWAETDPRIIYDHLHDRFFSTYFAWQNNPTGDDFSRLWIAVSNTSDPMGTWSIYTHHLTNDIPDMQSLGLTSDKVTVSYTRCDIDGPCYVAVQHLVIQKSDMLAGAGTASAVQSPPDNTHDWPRPAHSLTPVSTQYVVDSGDTVMHMWTITGTPDAGNVVINHGPHIAVGSMPSPPAAPNGNGDEPCVSGVSCINTVGQKILETIYRDGHLWTASTNACGNPARTCLRLIEIDTSTDAVINNFLYGNPGAGLYYYIPAIRTDASQNLYTVFTRSGATELPQVRMAGRLASDPVDTLSSSTLVKAGEALYTGFRWGDYMGAAVDDCDPDIVWLNAEYAKNDGFAKWGTWIGATSFTRPIEDNFCNAHDIESIRFTRSQSTSGATTEAGEPSASCAGMVSTTVWYKYTPSITQDLRVDTFGSDYDTTLAVWRGTSLGSLTEIGCNDEAGGTTQSEVKFTATAGQTYYFQVDGYLGFTGTLKLTLKLDNDDFSRSTQITSPRFQGVQNTTGATTEAGEPSGSCMTADSSVWYKYTPSITQDLKVETAGSDYDTELVVWRGTSLGSLAEVGCNDDTGGTRQSEVLFTAVAGQTYYFQIDGYNGAYGILKLTLKVDNDDIDQATQITSLPYKRIQNTTGATIETGEPLASCMGSPVEHSVWYSFSPSYPQDVVAETFGSNYDTELAVWVGSPVTEVACNDDAHGTLQSEVAFRALAGGTYYFQVDGFAGSTGTLDFDLKPALTPDLIESAVSNPLASQNRGTKFSVTDTAKNQGGQQAGPSYTRYYLSLDTVRNAGDKLLTGSRSVPVLAPGATSTGTKSVTIPGNTALGTYFLLACADDTGLVPEGDETNNCIASGGKIQVTAPDLKETALTNPPASVKRGGSFNVTDTTANVGTGPAGASTTQYYLSLDKTKGATDALLTGSRPVPALAAGATSSGTVLVTVPVATPLGTYYLLACVDDLKVVKFEIKEGNNCRASASKVQVTAP